MKIKLDPLKIIPLILFLLIFSSLLGQKYEYVYKNFGRKEGIISSEVYDLYQDSKGYIWAATDRGISRFDGNQFLNFTKENGLPDFSTFQFIEFSKDSVLGITASGNLYFMNPNTFEIKLFPYNETIVQHKKTSAIISDVYFEDSKWHISFLNWDFMFRISTDGIFEKIQLKDKSIEAGIIQISFERGKFRTQFINKKKYKQNLISFKKESKISTEKQEINKGSFGYSMQADSIFYQIVNRKVYVFNKNGYLETHEGDFEPISISKTGKKNIWIGSRIGGAHQINNPKNIFLAEHSVTKVLEDQNGGIWFATLEKGLFYVQNPNVLSLPFPKSIQKVTDLTFSRNKIYVGDKNGNIWFADPHYLNWQNLYSSQLEKEKRPAKVTYNPVDDIVYFATSNQFGTIENEEKLNLNPFPYYANQIKIENGIAFYLQNFHFLFYDDSEKKVVRPNIKIYDFIKKKNQYIVCSDKGVILCELNDSSTVHIDTLSSLILKKIYPINNSFVAYTYDNQTLYFDQDFKEVKDKKSDYEILSLGDQLMLHKHEFNPNLAKIFSSIEDLNLNINSYKIRHDSLWIALDTGLIVHTNLKLNPSQKYQIKIDSVVSEHYSWHPSNQIEIPWSNNSFSIHFSGFGSYFGEKLKFRYRILELKEEWHETEEKFANYSLGQGGILTFELEIYHPEKGWIETKTITLHQLIPFWEKIWFYILITLFIIAFMFLLTKMYYERLRKKRIKEFRLQEMELTALRAQMNPHFTFNTINSIQYYLLKNDKNKSQEYLAKFARLMRNILDLSSEQFVPLQTDLDHLQLYMDLEMLRFEEKFQYKIHIDPKINPNFTKIPPMLMQPFVENSIWHGLQSKQGKGLISIDIVMKSDYLEITIEDNGVGRNNKKNAKKEHRSKGVKITKERLELVNRMLNIENQISFTDLYNSNQEAVGTKVKMKIKFETNEAQPKNTDR